MQTESDERESVPAIGRRGEGFLERIGASVSGFLDETGKLSQLFFRSVMAAISPPFRWRNISEQMVAIGIESLPIALLTAAFTGMVFVLQTGTALEKFGAKTYAGGISAMGFAREIGPVLTSVVLAGRIGAGITAEIGTMKVTEQIDAMKTLGTDPVSYLVAPRLIAATLMLPAICVLAILVGLAGGYLVGVTSLGIQSGQYIQTVKTWLMLVDYTTGIGKTFIFGMIIAVVGCHCGFGAGWGAEGVGQATTKSVVMGSILILVANYFLTSWIIFLFP